MESDRKTMKSASGKRPPDLHRSASKKSAKFRHKHVRFFDLQVYWIILKMLLIFCNSGLKFTNFDDFISEFLKFVRKNYGKISKSFWLSFFGGFRNDYSDVIQTIVFDDSIFSENDLFQLDKS